MRGEGAARKNLSVAPAIRTEWQGPELSRGPMCAATYLVKLRRAGREADHALPLLGVVGGRHEAVVDQLGGALDHLLHLGLGQALDRTQILARSHKQRAERVNAASLREDVGSG